MGLKSPQEYGASRHRPESYSSVSMRYPTRLGWLEQMLSSQNRHLCMNSSSQSIAYCSLKNGGNLEGRAHPENRRSWKLRPLPIRPESVILILAGPLNQRSDAINREPICHRPCAFVPSTRPCSRTTAQPSTLRRMASILQLR